MPYKQGVTGSSPVVPTKFLIVCGAVVQLVRTPACHAGGRGFKSLPRRHFSSISLYAQVAQLVEQWTENPRVAGSIPALGTICECSSSGRAPPGQGGGSEFEPRHSLHSSHVGTPPYGGIPSFRISPLPCCCIYFSVAVLTLSCAQYNSVVTAP